VPNEDDNVIVIADLFRRTDGTSARDEDACQKQHQ